MGLKPPCETVVQEIMPAIRSLVAKELVKNYKMTEVEVARRMGITQAAVSQYIYGKRGKRKRLSVSLADLKEMAKDYAEMVAKEGGAKPGADWFCRYCLKRIMKKKA
jgi:predicted transcriptional regulator